MYLSRLNGTWNIIIAATILGTSLTEMIQCSSTVAANEPALILHRLDHLDADEPWGAEKFHQPW